MPEEITSVVDPIGRLWALVSVDGPEHQGYFWCTEGDESPLFEHSDAGLEQAFAWLR